METENIQNQTEVERQELEQFLEELVLHVERPEDIETLLEILKTLKDAESDAQHFSVHWSRVRPQLDRYDIFRMSRDRIVRIGFVRGAEYARRVLPGLQSLEGRIYFLHESGTAWRLVQTELPQLQH